MSIEAYILNDIPIRSIHSSIKEIQLCFNKLPHSHIPIERDGEFIGCLNENDVRSLESTKRIDDYEYILEKFSAHKEDSWLAVLENFARNNASLMPVINEKNQYLGYVELNDILGLFGNVPFLSEPGGILVVEKGISDYSFSEICQIIESNGGRIGGLFISQIKNDVTQITMKINSDRLNEIIQSFRRYSYNIVSEHHEDAYQQNLKERSDYLQRYLDV